LKHVRSTDFPISLTPHSTITLGALIA